MTAFSQLWHTYIEIREYLEVSIACNKNQWLLEVSIVCKFWKASLTFPTNGYVEREVSLSMMFD